MADTKTFKVRSTLPVAADGGSPVAFYEQDDAHPNGEAWVAGPDPVEVADTAGVQAALVDGRIEKVTTAKRETDDSARAKREADARKAAEEAEKKRLADKAARQQSGV